MRLFRILSQDWAVNKSNIKGRSVLFLFRLAQACRSSPKPFWYLFIPYLILYRVVVEWLLCIELPWNTKVGKGLKLFHGQALVINDNSIIGDYCTLRHSTTIGNKELPNGEFSKSPIIGNHVDIGSNVVIIGDIRIGDYVKIGAGSVVTKDLNNNGVYVGNPAKLLKALNETTSN
ncbi:Serine acetyltransferase [hydrothermal vent metagenome]|uniref:Serine acetyltransferase n=1 Tax=hydrothermal vent metagenome TaxID=652676 RepID=A0A3B0Y2D4_9ZZZZ